MNKGKLFVVATPIGNLKDITLRALETLQTVDYILCEDTRVTKKLLNHYQISKQTIIYYQHSPESKIKEIANLLIEDKNLAIVTDAGTPGISDPGNLLIQNLTKNTEIKEIIPIPGPCAAIAALSISGFPTDKFYFAGFPPHKNKRQKFFKELAARKETIIFYESTHRIIKTLSELQMFAQQREIMVARELTKQFETIYRGTVEQILEKIKKGPSKGEFVMVIKSI
ncbi:MAG: 16S rRNA (cytidine(1402)-2'-O)-methyltransferase [Candidatus Magasanikbacteria bacterium]|nr:16S rRNA (cytidine(1402)-2'-O)-methyltransferase [Candidatus Magasanikbacteria bacterium]